MGSSVINKLKPMSFIIYPWSKLDEACPLFSDSPVCFETPGARIYSPHPADSPRILVRPLLSDEFIPLLSKVMKRSRGRCDAERQCGTTTTTSSDACGRLIKHTLIPRGHFLNSSFLISRAHFNTLMGLYSRPFTWTELKRIVPMLLTGNLRVTFNGYHYLFVFA